MLSQTLIDSNYLFFCELDQPRLVRKALFLADGCQFTADEFLAQVG